MPRHVHKPTKDKSTKSLLQNIQDTQKTTKNIKADLLEHNSKIHLHAADALASIKASAPANVQKSGTSAGSQPGQSTSYAGREGTPSAQKTTQATASSPSVQNKASYADTKSGDSGSSAYRSNSNQTSSAQDSRKGDSPQAQPRASIGVDTKSEGFSSQGSSSAFSGRSDNATPPYSNMIELFQRSTQQWFEMQSKLMNMWLGGFTRMTSQDDK